MKASGLNAGWVSAGVLDELFGKLGFVGIAKGFPLGGKLSAKQTDEGAGLEQLSVHRHLIRFASLTTFPSRGRLSRVHCNPYKPPFVILSEAKDLKTPASTTTMRIVGYRCCKILQSLRSLRMTDAENTLPLKFKCHFPPPGNRATIMTL